MYPVHGVVTITIKVSGCAHPSEEGEKEFEIYIDPSGSVVDGYDHDAPVAGATVTLLASSRLDGPFSPVAGGSNVMSPANRTNPDTTTGEGMFGWDTLPGFYEVTASKLGCGSTTTHAFEVPPPVSDLRLVLHCSKRLKIETTSLSGATRGTPYESRARGLWRQRNLQVEEGQEAAQRAEAGKERSAERDAQHETGGRRVRNRRHHQRLQQTEADRNQDLTARHLLSRETVVTLGRPTSDRPG